jgi:tRNA nucleotidyltransferase/poly(A) polymerase
MLLRYAHHIPAGTRLGRAVADDERLAWVFPFLAKHPEADLMVVGGAARDLHLGHSPHELHLVLRGAPLRTLEKFLARRGQVTKHEHGLSVTPANCEGLIDIALPRTDVYHPREKRMTYRFDHALPHSHDANWRDLSMNAMAYSIREGLFHDPHRGLQTLDRGLVTAIGNPQKRFLARPLHSLRALRLAGNFQLKPDSATWEGIYQTLPHLHNVHFREEGHHYQVPRGLIGRELMRLLKREPWHNWELLRQSGGTNLLFQDLNHPQASSILKNLNQKKTGLAAILAALAYPHRETTQLQKWAQGWQVNTEPEVLAATKIASQLQRLTHADPEELRPTKFLSLFPTADLAEVLHVGNALLEERLINGEEARRLLALERLHQRYSWQQATAPRVRGRDLLLQGYAPGPELRFALRALRDQHLSV